MKGQSTVRLNLGIPVLLLWGVLEAHRAGERAALKGCIWGVRLARMGAQWCERRLNRWPY